MQTNTLLLAFVMTKIDILFATFRLALLDRISEGDGI